MDAPLVLFDAAGLPTLMDWDCLATSWRAYDLASMCRSLDQMVGPSGLNQREVARLFAAFLRGYTRHHLLTPTKPPPSVISSPFVTSGVAPRASLGRYGAAGIPANLMTVGLPTSCASSTAG